MKNKDYEQLYYDSQYEIRKLRAEIKYLNDELDQLKSKKVIDMQKYLVNEISKYKERGVTNEMYK